MLSPLRARSQPNHICSGAPGLESPTRVPGRSFSDLTIAVWLVGTSSATGGAAVSPKTSRGPWLAERGPKRRMESSVVATRSAWPCTSASAAPGSARVVRRVTSEPLAREQPLGRGHAEREILG